MTFERAFLYIRITLTLKNSFLKKISFHFEKCFLYIRITFKSTFIRKRSHFEFRRLRVFKTTS
nr:MAG TPA: hypothetical protein [Caudoviricetes sp.]